MIVFNFDWWALLSIAVSTLLPLVVGLVTTKMTPGIQKGILLAGLTVVLNFGAELLAWWNAGATVPYDLFSALLTTLVGFTIAVAAQFGIYRAKDSHGVSITDRVQAAHVGPVGATRPPEDYLHG